MLSSKDAFKTGFLARCACQGMTEPEILQTVKQASAQLDAMIKTAWFGEELAGHVGNLAGTVAKWGGGLALAVPPIAGGLAGYGLGMTTDINDNDVAKAKNQELLDAYHHNTDQLKRQRAIRDYQKMRKLTGRIL